ncbi:MAG: hypothetical protein QNL51_07480 [Opitutaceae bacterium]
MKQTRSPSATAGGEVLSLKQPDNLKLYRPEIFRFHCTSPVWASTLHATTSRPIVAPVSAGT